MLLIIFLQKCHFLNCNYEKIKILGPKYPPLVTHTSHHTPSLVHHQSNQVAGTTAGFMIRRSSRPAIKTAHTFWLLALVFTIRWACCGSGRCYCLSAQGGRGFASQPQPSSLADFTRSPGICAGSFLGSPASSRAEKKRPAHRAHWQLCDKVVTRPGWGLDPTQRYQR